MSEGEVKSGPQWARLIKRLLNPPFGTDTSERLLMGEAADAIRYLLERVSPVSEALITEVTEWRGCALYDPTMEGPRFKGWDRSALERCRATAEKAGAVPLPPRDCAVDAQTSLASLTTQLEAERERATKAEEERDRLAKMLDVEALVAACLKAPVNGVTIKDYLSYEAGDAVDLGIKLTEKTADGEPRFHWLSDIRGDEHDETEAEIIRRMLIGALAALKTGEPSHD